MKEVSNKITAISKLLVKRFGVPKRQEPLPDPVDMLIATILSQNTNDKNSYKAFINLKSKYKSWNEVSKLTLAQIEKEIKIAGLGKQKSAAIKNVLTSMLSSKGEISLDYMKDKTDEAIITELINYPGVGIKTASCVLLFAMDRNICPVDTHVHRTTNRIGLVKTNTPDKTFFLLNKNLPKGIAHRFHTNLIRLGREICKPARPLCYACPLLMICEYPDKNLSGDKEVKSNSFMLLDNVKTQN